MPERKKKIISPSTSPEPGGLIHISSILWAHPVHCIVIVNSVEMNKDLFLVLKMMKLIKEVKNVKYSIEVLMAQFFFHKSQISIAKNK